MRILTHWLLPMLLALGTVTAAEAKPLFNGEDLEGWIVAGGGEWSVEDGAIVGRTGNGEHGWLITESDYYNFVLEFEVMHAGMGNSGVQIRSHYIDEKMTGYQVEVDPDKEMYLPNNGGIYEEHGRGWLAQPEKDLTQIWKDGEWNHYRIVANGFNILTFINGEPIINLEDDQAIGGLIALQVHSGMEPPVDVRYRNIHIQELPRTDDWQALFNGENLEGWNKIGEEEWVVEDGSIVGRAVTDAYGYLSTDGTYQHFDVELEFQAESTGNSGLFYHSTFEGVNVRGVQCEIDPNPGRHTGGLYESAGRGWLVQPTEEAEKLLKPIGEWNHVMLSVHNQHIRTWVNGLKAVDYHNEEAKYHDGHIALQLHSGGAAGIHFKDIYINPAD